MGSYDKRLSMEIEEDNLNVYFQIKEILIRKYSR